MSKSILVLILFSVAFLGLMFFGAGFIWGHYHFRTSEIYVLSESIEVESASGIKGLIPKGTELHYSSSAHRENEYYLLLKVSEKEVIQSIKKSEFDSANGVKYLHSSK